LTAPGAALKPASPWLIAAMLLMTLLWSMNFYAATILTAQLPPFPAAGFRSLVGAIAICIYYFALAPGPRSPGSRADALRFMGLGAIGVGFNQYFFMEGMSRTSVSHGALIIALTPVLVLVLAALTGGERITALKLAGVVLATAGIAFLQSGTGRTGSRGNPPSIPGDLLVFTAASSFATYTVLTKRLAARAGQATRGLTVVTYGFIGSALAFVPGLLWALPRLPLAQVHLNGWLALIYMSLGSSVICYVVYYRALESMPASRVSALSYLQPLVAISTAIPLLGEPVTKSLVAGGVLILLGVLLAERG
jgi:drug/metabolite transporter (DMT)-like permease